MVDFGVLFCCGFLLRAVYLSFTVLFGYTWDCISCNFVGLSQFCVTFVEVVRSSLVTYVVGCICCVRNALIFGVVTGFFGLRMVYDVHFVLICRVSR